MAMLIRSTGLVDESIKNKNDVDTAKIIIGGIVIVFIILAIIFLVKRKKIKK